MSRLVKRYNKFWYLVIYDRSTGKQKYIKIGKCSRMRAEEMRSKIELEEIDKNFDVKRDDPDMTFAKFAERYLEYCETMKAKKTYIRDDLCARNLVVSIGEACLLKDVNNRIIERHTVRRLKEVAPRTVNIELGFIRKMFRYAVKLGFLKRLPFDTIEMVKEVKKPPRFLQKDEIKALLEKATPWVKPFIVIGLNAGLRKGEALNLKWNHIDFENRHIVVQSEGTFRTKTRDYRTVPLNEALYDDLKFLTTHWPHPTHNRWLPREPHQMEYLICKADGAKVDDIKTAFRNACRRAGLRGATPHTLRHTYASQLVMAGTSMRVVQQYLGHTTILTTMRYAHLSREHLADHADKICFRGIVDAPVLEIENFKKEKGGN